MPRVAPFWDAVAVASAKATLSLAVLSTGFVALSDDDFSRTVIAEQFAASPSLDPSGTSWLPLPFYVHGLAMTLFGRSFATAQATAVALGIVSALCIHRAALWLGLSRSAAGLGAIAAASIPTAARLGVCAQPEALAAGLVLLGAASTKVDGLRRAAGALSLSAACLCRYEPWAAAAAFAAIALHDAARAPRHGTNRERRASIACAAVALCAPLAWIVHGAAAHGDALFFLHRVAAYRRALGESEPLARSLVAYPAALFRAEPEVTLAAVACAGIAAWRAPRALRAAARPSLVVAALFVFLVVGRVLDGAPTHHAERTLLPVFSFAALIAAQGVDTLRAGTGGAVLRTAPVVAGIALGSLLLRAGATADPGAPRTDERAVGVLARRRAADGERLLVDTADYGYFAVIAAFGAPERADPVDRHDPRQPVAEDPLATEARAAAFVRRGDARWLVVDAPHLPDASALGRVVGSAGRLSLVQLSPLR